MLSAVLLATAGRHATYLVGPLAAKLRTSPRDPFALFLIIAVCDAFTLVAGVAGLVYASDGLHTSLLSVPEAALDLFAFRRWADVLALGPSQTMVQLLGVLAYSVIAKSITSLDQFSRKDEDVRNLAAAYVQTGDYQTALSWMSQERQPVAASFDTRASIELGRGRFDVAVRYGRAQRHASGENDSIELVVQRLSSISLLPPLSEDDRVAFVKYCLKAGVSYWASFWSQRWSHPVASPPRSCPSVRRTVTRSLAPCCSGAGATWRKQHRSSQEQCPVPASRNLYA